MSSELDQKRQELEQLFADIKRLEATSPQKPKMSSTLQFSQTNNSSTVQCLQVEAQLQQTLTELDRVKEEKKAATALLSQKDEAVRDLKLALDNANRRIDKMESKEQASLEEQDALKEELLKQKEENQKQQKQLRDLKLDAAKKSVVGSGTGEQYFFHLNKLENELIEKDQVISQLRDEVKKLEKNVRTSDRMVSDLTRENELKGIANTELQDTENKLRLLAHQLEDLESENKVLRHVQRLKTQAIEQLTSELEVRGASEEFVTSLKSEVANRDKIIETMRDELETKTKELRKLESDLNGLAEQDESPVSMGDWFEERRSLKANITRLQVAKGHNESEIKSLRARIAQLENRLEQVVESVRETAQLSGRMQQYANKECKVENDNGFVAQELYEVLEKNLQVTKAKLREKEEALSEKDELMETLERRVDVLNKARQADAKKSKKSEAELATSINQLRTDMDRAAKEYKEALARLRTENINMHRRLDRALTLQAEYEDLQDQKDQTPQTLED